MTPQPPLPEMPTMQPMAQPVAEPAKAQPAQAASTQKTTAIGSQRLRQFVGYIGGASLGFVLLVLLGQLVLRDDLKPTALLATIEAQTHLGILNQNMGFGAGEHVLNEAQYQEIVARAQRKGQADAELGFQRQLAVVQADQQRVVAAYSTLYQRTNVIAQAGLQVEADAQTFRQRLLEETNGGRAVVLNVEDGLCALGSQEACEKAATLRAGMIAESTQLSKSDLQGKINELMAGVPDPATFVVRDDQRRNGVPALPR